MRYVDAATIRALDLVSDGNQLCRVEFVNVNYRVVNITAMDIDGELQYLTWPKGRPILKCTDKRISVGQ